MSFDFFRPIIQENHATQLFTVKYTPKRLENVAGQSKIIQTLIKYRQEQNMPNLIITGPPGSGKKTTVNLLARSFLKSYYEEAHYLIDGAIDRGKHVISETTHLTNKKKRPTDTNITSFLKRRTNLPPGRFKIITITDFDHMTDEAQMALRRIIETQANRVRFIFIANDCKDIIEAIQSRCVIMKFNALSGSDMLPVLQWVVQREYDEANSRGTPEGNPPRTSEANLPGSPEVNPPGPPEVNSRITPELLELIILAAYGDLKQALIYLQIMLNTVPTTTNSDRGTSATNQSFHHLGALPISFDKNCRRISGELLDGGNSATNQFYEIFGLPQLPRIRQLLAACYKSNPKAYHILQELIDDGYTADDLLDILYKIVLLDIFKITESRQHAYLEAIAKTAYYTEYTGTNHHMYAMIADFIRAK